MRELERIFSTQVQVPTPNFCTMSVHIRIFEYVYSDDARLIDTIHLIECIDQVSLPQPPPKSLKALPCGENSTHHYNTFDPLSEGPLVVIINVLTK